MEIIPNNASSNGGGGEVTLSKAPKAPKIVVKSRSVKTVKRCKKKCEKRAGAGEREGSLSQFSHRHRPISQVARVLFSLCSF